MRNRYQKYNKSGCLSTLLILLLLIVGGCSASAKQGQVEDGGFYTLRYYHDDQRSVSCWALTGNSLSCIPDKDLR